MKQISVYQVWDKTTDKVITTLTGYKDEYIFKAVIKWAHNAQIETNDIELIKLGTVDEPLTVEEKNTIPTVYFEDVIIEVDNAFSQEK